MKAASTSARSVGWLPLTASSQSAPWAAMARATSALVAMASMETSAPSRPCSAPSRSSNGVMAASSLALSGTASWASTRRAVVAKAKDEVQWRRFGAAVVAAPRGFAIDGQEPGLRTNSPAHPAKAAANSAGLMRFIGPSHQDGEPAFAGNAVLVGQVPAQEAEVRSAPGGDVLVVVAVSDGAADDESSTSGSGCRIRRTSRVFLGLGEMIQQRREARLPGQGLIGDHGRLRHRFRENRRCYLPYEFGAVGGSRGCLQRAV